MIHEMVLDLRARPAALGVKIALTALVSLAVFAVGAVGARTEAEVGRVADSRSGRVLYGLVDTLADPERYEEFRAEEGGTRSVAAFYDALSSSTSFEFPSLFNHMVPVVDFPGGEQYRHVYEGLGGPLEPYPDPLGRTVTDIKSFQLNQDAYEFYGIELSQGPGLDWQAVDYSSGEPVPVLVGSSLASVYSVGTSLQGWLGGHPLEFRVAGVVDSRSAVYLPGQPSTFLDEALIIPYPHSLGQCEGYDMGLCNSLAFAMVNGTIAAPASMRPSELLDILNAMGAACGFEDYTLLGTPIYTVQLGLMRDFVERQGALVRAIAVAVALCSLTALAGVGLHLWRGRRPVVRAWLLLGWAPGRIARTLTALWVRDAVILAAIVIPLVAASASFDGNWGLVGLGAGLGLIALEGAGHLAAVRRLARGGAVRGGGDEEP
ncbi:hypothetical protein J5X07_01465 [Actinomyces bowdenii]|uniref:hypothetical protein n=1 Tax=Actinomyces bowdenii TaxID=131109 RepID=UPI001ABBF710|nr:hypothetical protein [Actinomyces bowdenii]MBO3723713.1 hypothetical protein [Actinomyces bowdenii]